MNLVERMEEATKYGNTVILKASEQAGFLAAALIASIVFWKSDIDTQLIDKIAYVSLSVSIFMSIFTHFSLGYTYVKQIKDLSDGKKVEHAFIIKSGWLFGLAQIFFLIVGLSVILLNIF